MQALLGVMLMHALHAALEDGEAVFDSVGVEDDEAALLGIIENFVRE